MLAFQWLNRFVTQCRLHAMSRLNGGSVGRPATTGEAMSRSERRLKLMRLEQRRVLNADFTFVAQSNLTLSHIDGDLAVREVGDRIEFDLAGSTWNHLGGNGTFSIDNSQVNRSILSIDRSELSGLNAGFSISADPNGTHQLTFETQNAAIDLQMAAGPLAIRDFEDVRQVGSHDLLVQDFSVAARNTIELLNLRGDDLTLSAAEIDFNGGQHSIAGSSLSIATGSSSSIELGGSVDQANVLDFTSAEIGALSGGFQSLSFSAHGGYLSGDGANGSIVVLSSGADVREALTLAAHANHQSANQADVGHLQLSADSIRIDGELTSAGGVIEVSATHDVTISHHGGIVNHGGEILVDAGVNGTLLVSGHVDASSVGSHEVDSEDGVGGRIHLLGEQVGLFGGARVDASGDNGGGEVLIGGDLHGGNEAIHHALRTYVGSDVEINADARLHGDGGKVVLWSDEVSQVYGLLTARGGALSGDGGLIETSSRGQLLLNGGGDASAANGDAGTWLIDPLNVGIVHQLTLFPTIIEFNELPDFAPSVSGSEVTDDAIEAQLNMGTNVVITTENLNYSEAGNVTQAADATIDVTFIADGDSATLTIIAANDIELNGGITASNGALSVVLTANAVTNNDDLNRVSGSVTLTAALDLNGGSFESTGVNFDSTSVAITAAGGVTITHTGGIDLGQIYSGTGTGGTLLLSGATAQGEISVGEGDIAINGGNADTVVFGDVSATASVIISANRDVLIREAKVTVTGPMSDLTITADADSDGSGGFWLDEGTSAEDAQLIASHNITIIGSDLHAPTDRNGGVRIDGDDANQQVIAGNDLTLLSNFDAASTTGDIVIEGVQVATSGSLTVFAKSQIFLGADQTAGNDVLFKSAVKLTNDVVITADNDVTFDSTVDESTDAISSALTVTTSSPGAGVLFVGAIGADFVNGGPIDSLNVNGVGFVDFLNTVAIDGDINVTTTSSVDIVTFQNAVTTTTGNVTITNAGLLVTSSNATFELGGHFQQNGDGSTELGASITADGDISFAQAVLLTSTLADSVTINIGSVGGNITFSSTIDSNVVPLALLDGVLVPISQVGGEVVDVRPEHNSLVLTAGSGTIRFDGDIGAGFLDVGVPSDGNQMLGVGADGDQMLGALIVESAGRVEIGSVSLIAVDGEIDFGSANEITGGIEITGLSDPGTLTIQSRFGEIHGGIHRNDSRSININGPVTTQVDLVILAADGVTLTDAADITTNDHNIVINGDTNQDMAGDLVMGPETLIDAGSGYIDLSANNVLLGALESTNSNSTYADHPAIRVEATTGSIIDGDGTRTDITAHTTDSGVVLIAVTGIGSGNALETDIASLSAYNHDIVEEQQTITLENVIGGTFTISWQPPDSLPEETTQPIRFNATATEIRDALLSFDSLKVDDINCIDVTSVGGGQFVLTFSGAYRGVDVNDITVSGDDLVGTSDVATVGTEASGVSTTTTPLKPAEGNIEIDDVGTTTGQVDLIFVHNEANQVEPQFATSSQSFDGTFPPAIPNDPPPPPVDVQFEFFAVKPGPESNDIVINFTSSPHTGMTLGLPVITVTGHTIDIDLDSNGTAANTLRNAINTNEQANVLIHARIISSADTVASNIADSATGVSIDLDDVGSQTGVIDINIEHGDLTVVDDQSRPVYLDMREGLDPGGDRAIAAVQSENTIRLTANTITILDDLLAIQDSAPDDQMLGERIEIYARNNFVLGDDRVITTDEHYISSISEDRNGNGVLDTTEDVNLNGVLDSGEDRNRNGVIDAGEDVNGNGQLDYNRNSQPETFADDPNRDQITIMADSDYEAGGPRAGSVLLGTNSTISTDSGIEQQISPRPVLTPNALQPFLYKSDTAFFSGEVIVSNLDTNGELDGKPLYIGSLTFTIGVAGEKNLVLDIDWGDLTPAYRDNLVSPTQLADGSFRFDRVTDRTATRFLIPEGGHTYVIPHEYTQNALNLKTNEGVDTDQPGRNLTSDPLQVRFAVSHHSSIRIEGQSVLNPDGTTEDVPKNHPYDAKTEPVDADNNPVELKHDGRYLLSSTDVSDDPTAFLPRFDNGVAAFTIPTSKSVSFFIPPDPVIVPIETPKLVTTETTIVPPSQLTTETTVVASSSSTVTTTEYFELRRFGDDGTVEIERLNDFQGDGLLDKERFEKFISDKGDGEYEIWFITRENSSGTMIERPVIHFRLEGGHLAPPPNDSPLLFKPFKLIPLPAAPKPANDAGEAAGESDGAEESEQSPKIEIQEENSSDSTRSSGLSTSSGNLSATDDNRDGIEFSNLDSAVQTTASLDSSSASTASLAAGVLVFAGTQRWARRSKEAALSPFSRSARLARKLAE